MMTSAGRPIEVVFTLDWTESMSSSAASSDLYQILHKLLRAVPEARVAYIAHGDYCDKDVYVTKHVDFTNDIAALMAFHKTAGYASPRGGDWEECYELVLRQACELLSWTAGTQKALVMIGDAIPHPANDPQNKDNIDWKDEVNRLRDELGVKIYPVQVYKSPQAEPFWRQLASRTGGKFLRLEDIHSIIDILTATYSGVKFAKTSKHVGPIRRSRRTEARREADQEWKSIVRKARRRYGDTPDSRYSLDRQHRETVPGSANVFETLPWSPWHLAMAARRPPDAAPRNWIPRRNNVFGVRNAALFDDCAFTPAVYELAVQLANGHKKYPMCLRGCSGGSSGGGARWDTKLLTSASVNRTITSVLQKGCNLYVRRASVTLPMTCNGQVVSSVGELKELMMDTYDYAWRWKTCYEGARPVVRKGVAISEYTGWHWWKNPGLGDLGPALRAHHRKYARLL